MELETRPYISNLAVDERWRRQGVGEMLMRACEAEASAWPSEDAFDHVWLEVSTTNEGALAFYDRLGWVLRHLHLTSISPPSQPQWMLWGWCDGERSPPTTPHPLARRRYEDAGQTSGREIVKQRFGFASLPIQRRVMRKSLKAIRSDSELVARPVLAS
jgi:ribosomal protein S18 acetylase RimI-like enzyme